jgi:ACT domain-containing protein
MTKKTNQEAALVALLNSKSIAEAARKSGISLRTLHRYLEEPDFQREYRKARSAIVENAVGRIQSMVSDAADTLHRNLSCEIPAAEVRTAQIIIDTALRGREQTEIIERLEALENENTK